MRGCFLSAILSKIFSLGQHLQSEYTAPSLNTPTLLHTYIDIVQAEADHLHGVHKRLLLIHEDLWKLHTHRASLTTTLLVSPTKITANCYSLPPPLKDVLQDEVRARCRM